MSGMVTVRWYAKEASTNGQEIRCATFRDVVASPQVGDECRSESHPRMMGSTAIARSLCRNHSIALELGAGLVASLRTLASTR